jgi:hypothetical protein
LKEEDENLLKCVIVIDYDYKHYSEGDDDDERE